MGPLGLCICCANEDDVGMVKRAAMTAGALSERQKIGVLCVCELGMFLVRSQRHKAFFSWRAPPSRGRNLRTYFV